MIELSFPLHGDVIPHDHGYLLYGAITTVIPAMHKGELPFQLAPVTGDGVISGTLTLGVKSHLRVRVAPDDLPRLLPLSGRSLTLASHTVRVGIPSVRALEPAASLAARLVTIKGFTQPAPFLEAVRRQLDALGVGGEAAIPVATSGRQTGQPLRRILRVRDKRIVGFALHVTALAAEESLRLQEQSVGGRQHLGAGYFVPLRPRRA